MASSYTAKGGERLDNIVTAEFGDLGKFEETLKNNPHLQGKIFLDTGDVVNFLSEIKKEFSVAVETTEKTDSTLVSSTIQSEVQIVFKEPLNPVKNEENIKALW